MIKRTSFFVAIMLLAMSAMAQNAYWVFLADKADTKFDPYKYFDSKAIERYQLNGADLYDISNYPLNEGYVRQVDALATEEIGTSRWMNAIGVTATPEQIAQIEALPFVKRVQMINSTATLCTTSSHALAQKSEIKLSDQITRQQGKLFKEAGIDGKGVRVAVFDGGFPRVNTHQAFKHLRDNHQIIKTWNFPNKKEDVYGWSTHGTMVLSCIAGIKEDSVQLGLATGAEFLLARTEVEAEPFKEEVWWMQAMEWADKNGAQVISSSLGYGKQRHYTKDMDGTSYVAKAANMAVRKGMVVCNSAGNEGDDKSWYTIITPADADSVICVGGIENSLEEYKHIYFSSFGPTADGRMKPDLVNFGYANVADPNGDNRYDWVNGTSFSCPLTSGFVACAIQAHPGRTAMQMKQEVIASCDLYPYADYAFGHGVPQADYFVGKRTPVEPSFEILDSGDCIHIHPLRNARYPYIFINAELKSNGQLERYQSHRLASPAEKRTIYVAKSSLVNRKLNISYDGYYQQYELDPATNQQLIDSNEITEFFTSILDSVGDYDFESDEILDRTPEDNYVNEHKMRSSNYYQIGSLIRTSNSEEQFLDWSPAWTIGMHYFKPITKWYSLGIGVEWRNIRHRIDPANAFATDYLVGITPSTTGVEKKTLIDNQFNLELFQKLRLKPTGGMLGDGIYWDLGIYGGINCYKMYMHYSTQTVNSDRTGTVEGTNRARFDHRDLDRLTWGLTTRLSWNIFAVYARYNMSHLGGKGETTDVHNHIDQLPRLEVGLQLGF